MSEAHTTPQGTPYRIREVRILKCPVPLSVALDARQITAERGPWVPASGGTEIPFVTRTGHRLQYLWQPTTGKHAYIDCDTDILLTDEEARRILGHS